MIEGVFHGVFFLKYGNCIRGGLALAPRRVQFRHGDGGFAQAGGEAVYGNLLALQHSDMDEVLGKDRLEISECQFPGEELEQVAGALRNPAVEIPVKLHCHGFPLPVEGAKFPDAAPVVPVER